GRGPQDRAGGPGQAGGHRRQAEEVMSPETVIALIGAPYDGAATLGWPGARYAPDEVRRHLGWMKIGVQQGEPYWDDEGRLVRSAPAQLADAGDAPVVPHDPLATSPPSGRRPGPKPRAGASRP